MFKSAQWMMLLLLPALWLWAPQLSFAADDAAVALQDQGAKVTLSNGIVSVTFNKIDGTIPEMHLRDSPNLAGKGAYFAVANSGGHDGWDMKNAEYKVVRNTPDLVELSFGAPIGGVYFTQHYVLRRGDQGFYVFIHQRHLPEDHTEKFGQTRWSFYLNPALFNYEIANDQVQRPIPDFTGAESVQDATYRLKDGTVYTKYDYVDYLEGHYAHGITGTGPGSYGVFIVRGSNDYLGAPTRQEITVHSGPIIHQFLQSGHFLPRDIAHPTLPAGWTKLAGPWFVYLDAGDSPQQMWQDTKAQVEKEKAYWPYQWMNDAEYPLHRGEVSGTLKLYDGSRPAANALLVLTAPEPNWQVQILNYIFSTRADANGHFTIPNVRPGSYTLFAAIPGATDEFRQDNITVAADGKVNLGDINFNPSYYSALLWQIGYPDLRTTGFKLSDQPRQYGLDKTVPAELTYTIGRSTPSQNWYYAQDKPGDWKVNFAVDKAYGGEGVLTIGIAGQTNDPKLEVLLNDKSIGTVTTAGNSSALYRSAILGSSYYENKVLRFPASLLRQDNNTLTLRLTHGSIMYDVVKMEIDDPKLPKQIPPLVSPPTQVAPAQVAPTQVAPAQAAPMQNAAAFKFDFGSGPAETGDTLITPEYCLQRANWLRF